MHRETLRRLLHGGVISLDQFEARAANATDRGGNPAPTPIRAGTRGREIPAWIGDRGPGSLTVRWRLPRPPGGAEPSGFEIRRRTVGAGAWQTAVRTPMGARESVERGLRPGAPYEFDVRGVFGEDGERGPWMKRPARGVPEALPEQAAPALRVTVVEVTDTTASLGWRHEGPVPTGGYGYRTRGGGDWVPWAFTHDLRAVVRELTPGTRHQAQVFARLGAEESPGGGGLGETTFETSSGWGAALVEVATERGDEAGGEAPRRSAGRVGETPQPAFNRPDVRAGAVATGDGARAMLAEDALRAAGYVPVGPFGDVAAMLEAAARGEFGCAVLDAAVPGFGPHAITQLSEMGVIVVVASAGGVTPPGMGDVERLALWVDDGRIVSTVAGIADVLPDISRVASAPPERRDDPERDRGAGSRAPRSPDDGSAARAPPRRRRRGRRAGRGRGRSYRGGRGAANAVSSEEMAAADPLDTAAGNAEQEDVEQVERRAGGPDGGRDGDPGDGAASGDAAAALNERVSALERVGAVALADGLRLHAAILTAGAGVALPSGEGFPAHVAAALARDRLGATLAGARDTAMFVPVLLTWLKLGVAIGQYARRATADERDFFVYWVDGGGSSEGLTGAILGGSLADAALLVAASVVAIIVLNVAAGWRRGIVAGRRERIAGEVAGELAAASATSVNAEAVRARAGFEAMAAGEGPAVPAAAWEALTGMFDAVARQEARGADIEAVLAGVAEIREHMAAEAGVLRAIADELGVSRLAMQSLAGQGEAAAERWDAMAGHLDRVGEVFAGASAETREGLAEGARDLREAALSLREVAVRMRERDGSGGNG